MLSPALAKKLCDNFSNPKLNSLCKYVNVGDYSLGNQHSQKKKGISSILIGRAGSPEKYFLDGLIYLFYGYFLKEPELNKVTKLNQKRKKVLR